MATVNFQSMTPLDDKLQAILVMVAGWQEPDVPKLSLLAGRLGYADESGVRYHIRRLKELGLLEVHTIGPGRGYYKLPEVTAKGRAALGLQPEPTVVPIKNARLKHPLPINPAQCGPLAPTATEPDQVADWLGDIFESFRDGDYLLIARGDSMLSPDGESIADGDRCLVRPDIWPGNGEVVHVEYMLDNGLHDVTLKEWHHDEATGTVTLTARNPAYPDIVRTAEQVENIVVRGVVLEVVHSVRKGRR